MAPTAESTSAASFRWDPDRYEAFAEHRARPFHDLLARVGAVSPRRVVDLGCGPGTRTVSLARRWPHARVVGIDSSAEMVDRARDELDRTPELAGRLSYEKADVVDWTPDPEVDVVVSNAMLQWIPDHPELMSAWLEALRPGSWLGVQVPHNADEPSHRTIRELGACEPFASAMGTIPHTDTVLAPEDYAGMLLRAGWTADVWQTRYEHVLTGPDPVASWTAGAALRPSLDALARHDAAQGTDLREQFHQEYRRRLREAYPPVVSGGEQTLYGFSRLFVVGHRPD